MAIDAETLSDVIRFHGHMCAGLAMGVRAAEVALDEIGPNSQEEEVVAVVETDMCGVDAIQFLTGCTFGKGNLVHHDYGKNAYTFIRRSDGRSIRVSSRPEAWGRREPEFEALFSKVRVGEASGEERQRFWELQRQRSEAILAAPFDALYEVRHIKARIPPRARILASVPCTACGEPTMETRIRRLDGRELCVPCFEAALEGAVPVAAPRQREAEAASERL